MVSASLSTFLPLLSLLLFLLLAPSFSLSPSSSDKGHSRERDSTHASKRTHEDDFLRTLKTGEKEFDLTGGIQRAKETINLIYNRYEMFKPIGRFFQYYQINMAEKDWDILKYNFAIKTLTANSQYLMIFGGSSVTAGHDNKFEDSYPMVVKDRLAPVMKALNIDFAVSNIAQGANNCIPSNLCYESMGGDDPDFVGWEQSFNCGHNAEIFEVAARFVAWSKNPGMIFYSQSGSAIPTKCNASVDNPPYSAKDWTPKAADLPEFLPSREEVAVEKSRMIYAFKQINSSGRFGGSVRTRYPAIAVSGTEMWTDHQSTTVAKNKDFDLSDVLKTPKFSIAAVTVSCNLKALTKDAAVYGNGKGAKWHPTTGIHLMRGETIAYTLLLPLLDALYTIEDDIKAGKSPSEMLEKYNTERKKLQPGGALPTPQFCAKPSWSCATKPYCYTDYRPHYNANYTLRELVVGTHQWECNYPDSLSLPFPDKEHIELRPGFHPSKGHESGEIHFKIKVGDYKLVTVCGYHYGNSASTNEFRLDINVPEELLNDKYQPREGRTTWTNLATVDTVCVSLTDLPPGIHVLSIQSKKDVPDAKSKPGVSHIIMWP